MKLFAKHILAIANETKKITNLQLQKIFLERKYKIK